MSLGVAFKAFFAALSNAEASQRIQAAMAGEEPPKLPEKKTEPAPQPTPPKPPARSDAVALLAALQREARFVDLVREPLDGFSDQQIGAASRDVLQGCAQVLDRMFAIAPVLDHSEGETVEVPTDYDPAIYRWSGDTTEGGQSGKLVHAGWKVTKQQLPQWKGSEAAAPIISAAEVEKES